MNNKVMIVGCGGHSKSVMDVILFNGISNDIVFLDNKAQRNEKIACYNVVNKLSSCYNKYNFFCGIGDNNLRRSSFKKFDFKKLISHDSYIGYKSVIGKGSFIAHGAHIGPFVKIGKGCIINTNCVIDHEATIGDFSHVSVNCTVCGKVIIGKNVFVGAGTVVKDNINICNDVIIGCNSNIINDIKQSGIYVGNPVRKIK